MNKKSFAAAGVLFLWPIFSLYGVNADYIDSAEFLAQNGVINSQSDSKDYKTLENITRGEIAKVMLNLAGVKPNTKCNGYFSDITATTPNTWVCGYAEKGYELGLLSKNENFRANDKISKAESIKMILGGLGVKIDYEDNSWQEDFINKAYEENLISTKFTDYNNPAQRGYIFSVGSNGLKKGKISFEKKKISINFSSAMDEDSVEENLKIFPELKYEADWIDPKNLDIIIEEEIDKELSILVNILDEAVKENGEKLDKTISKQFKVEATPKVDFVSPVGNITDVNKGVVVRFSSPVIPLTNIESQTTCPITFSPNIEGKCRWLTTTTFKFLPEKGFPMGGDYQVEIGDGLVKNTKTYNITTPKFELDSTSSRNFDKDQKIIFDFNDNVEIDDFKKLFSLKEYSNSELEIIYGKDSSPLENELKNIITVFPKTGDWGYSKNLNYTLKKDLTSKRGNIPLNIEYNVSLTTNDFLTNFEPFVFLDENYEEKYLTNNFKFSSDKKIITKENPKILLTFFEEVELNKNLIQSNYDFELNYAKKREYKNDDYEISENKKQLVITFKGEISGNLNLTIKNQNLTFNTTSNFEIIDLNQINYKKACLQTSAQIDSYTNFSDNFVFDNYGIVNSIYKVRSYSRDKDCMYVEGKNTYILNTQLNPNLDYNLTVKKELLNNLNYGLKKDYYYTFKTPEALNEDKYISIVSQNKFNLTPTSINPLSVGITGINVDKFKLKACLGDTDIESDDYIKNPKCTTKTVEINNYGFKPNISVYDISNFLEITDETDLEGKIISVNVEKIDSDKTDGEKKYDNDNNSTYYMFSDISATIKAGNNGVLWLYNFNSGENIDDEIDSIKAYNRTAKYNLFGKYEKTILEYKDDIDFKFVKYGVYSITPEKSEVLLITLKNGKKIILDSYINISNINNTKNYLSTSKPIYKAGEKVNIYGISRNVTATGYEINSGTVELSVRNPKYKTVLNKEIKTDEKGNIDFSFELGEKATLGNYTIDVGGDSISFAVEEYEKPDFKIETKAEVENYLTSQNAKININGEYYIGMPLASGEGRYEVSTTDYNFDGGKTNGYEFGENNFNWWRIYDDYNSSDFYNSGIFVLDENGNYTLDLKLDKTSDKIYTISTTITDPNTKKSISTNTTFVGYNSPNFVGLKTDKYFYNFGDTAKIDLISVDIEGNKKKDTEINLKINKINYLKDSISYSVKEEKNLLVEEDLLTNNSGTADFDFKFEEYGKYEIEITNKYSYKTTKTLFVSGGGILLPQEADHKLNITADKEIYNIGDTANLTINSPVKNLKALLTVESLDKILSYKIIEINDFSQKYSVEVKKEYLPNFKVGIYAISNMKKFEENIEELKKIRAEMLEIENELQTEKQDIVIPYFIYDLQLISPVGDEELNEDLLKKLSILRLEEANLLQQILPNYLEGNIDLKLNTESISLNTEILLDKINYLPGDKTELTFDITDNSGEKVDGYMNLKIIDESLLALKQNNIDIKDYFYSKKENHINTYSNIENILKRIEFSNNNLGGGGGADFTTDSAMFRSNMMMNKSVQLESFMMEETTESAPYEDDKGDEEDSNQKLRTNFQDLAYYKGVSEIKNGKLTIIVDKLPDNLTTWNIAGTIITDDTKVGTLEKSFITQKNISILPQIPQFFIGGDKANIGALVANNKNNSENIEIKLNIFGKNYVKNINISENSSNYTDFDIEIPETEELTNTKITISANGSDDSDAIQVSKVIYPNVTAEYVFTNGMTNDLSFEENINFKEEYLDKAKLEISLNSTILTNLITNLENNLNFPGNNFYSKIKSLKMINLLEELYSKANRLEDFKEITLVDYNGESIKILDLKDTLIKEIPGYLQSDNGFAYFKDCQTNYFRETCSNFRLTGDYLELQLDIDGINNEVIYNYYKKELENYIKELSANNYYPDLEYYIPASIFGDKNFIEKNLKNNLENLSNLEKIIYLEIFNNLGEKNNNTDKFLKELKNYVFIEARGTVLPNGKIYGNYNNSGLSARFLSLLTKNNENEVLLTNNLARYIVANKDENGGYYGNPEKILEGILDYIDFTDELDNVDFESKGYINSKEIIKAIFEDENKFTTQKETFDLKDFVKPGVDNKLGFEKIGTGKLYYDLGIKYNVPNEDISAYDNGIIVEKNFYDYEEYKEAFKKECFTPWVHSHRLSLCRDVKIKNIENITSAEHGDFVIGEISITLPVDRKSVIINDYIPAGMSILNTNFDTTSDEVKEISNTYSGFSHIEQKSNQVLLFADYLNSGTYTFKYVLKAQNKGIYTTSPSRSELIDTPEVWGRTAGGTFEIK